MVVNSRRTGFKVGSEPFYDEGSLKEWSKFKERGKMSYVQEVDLKFNKENSARQNQLKFEFPTSDEETKQVSDDIPGGQSSDVLPGCDSLLSSASGPDAVLLGGYGGDNFDFFVNSYLPGTRTHGSSSCGPEDERRDVAEIPGGPNSDDGGSLPPDGGSVDLLPNPTDVGKGPCGIDDRNGVVIDTNPVGEVRNVDLWNQEGGRRRIFPNRQEGIQTRRC